MIKELIRYTLIAVAGFALGWAIVAQAHASHCITTCSESSCFTHCDE